VVEADVLPAEVPGDGDVAAGDFEQSSELVRTKVVGGGTGGGPPAHLAGDTCAALDGFLGRQGGEVTGQARVLAHSATGWGPRVRCRPGQGLLGGGEAAAGPAARGGSGRAGRARGAGARTGRAPAGTDPDAPDLTQPVGELLLKVPDFAVPGSAMRSPAARLPQDPPAPPGRQDPWASGAGMALPRSHLRSPYGVYAAEPGALEHDAMPLLDMTASHTEPRPSDPRR
jgi:hypothetical protein